MKALFLHGWQSVLGGIKPPFLARHGHEVINPKLPAADFAEGWSIECVKPTRAEVRPDLKDVRFSEGGPKAW